MRLYSYCLRFDDGAAPNPYWGVCTLVICKPAIRCTASEGDWVVGLGSVNSSKGDLSSSVIYAMKVADVMSIEKYDEFCQKQLGGKVPDSTNNDFKRRVGDCIYDFGNPTRPTIRKGVHDEGNRATDLGGKNALLSTHFYYFGDQPILLPEELHPIIHRTQGHKSKANENLIKPFITWIEGAGLNPNQLYGEPQLKEEILKRPDCKGLCAIRDREDDEEDRDCS